jgi:hypothetical protein
MSLDRTCSGGNANHSPDDKVKVTPQIFTVIRRVLHRGRRKEQMIRDERMRMVS